MSSAVMSQVNTHPQALPEVMGTDLQEAGKICTYCVVI